MLKMSGRKTLTAMLSLLTLGAALSIGMAKALAADDVTEDEIVRALAPPKKPLTRGLSVGPQADPAAVAAEGRFVQTIRGRSTRSLSNSEREEIATIAKDKPNIDLEINFDYNSADISAKSLPSVQALGKALTNPDLKARPSSSPVIPTPPVARPTIRTCPNAARIRSSVTSPANSASPPPTW